VRELASKAHINKKVAKHRSLAQTKTSLFAI